MGFGDYLPGGKKTRVKGDKYSVFSGGASGITAEQLQSSRTRGKGGPMTRLTGSESTGAVFDAPYRMLTGYDPNAINRSDVPGPDAAPEPLRDAPTAARRARQRALLRALQRFGMRGTQASGSLGVTGQADIKRPTLGV